MRLSPRERQVALLIADGKTDKQIAAELNRSFHTIRGYRKSVFKKLGIHKAVEIAGFLVSVKISTPPEAPVESSH